MSREQVQVDHRSSTKRKVGQHPDQFLLQSTFHGQNILSLFPTTQPRSPSALDILECPLECPLNGSHGQRQPRSPDHHLDRFFPRDVQATAVHHVAVQATSSSRIETKAETHRFTCNPYSERWKQGCRRPPKRRRFYRVFGVGKRHTAR